MILGVMHPGMAFLVLIGILVLFVVGLMASGNVKVSIEVESDEEYEKRKAAEKVAKEEKKLKKEDKENDS